MKLQFFLFAILELFLIAFSANMATDHHWAAVVCSGLSAVILAVMEAALLVVWAIRNGR